jgi:hypothetical protein
MPGRPSRGWPTGWPQLPQNRLLSGTLGSASTADAGSSEGTDGTSTSPAPSLPLDRRLLPDREPRLPGRLPVPTDPDIDPPDNDSDADNADPADDDDAAEKPDAAPKPDAAAKPDTPGLDAADPAGPAVPEAGADAAASPHTVQNPSSIVPPHPR